MVVGSYTFKTCVESLSLRLCVWPKVFHRRTTLAELGSFAQAILSRCSGQSGQQQKRSSHQHGADYLPRPMQKRSSERSVPHSHGSNSHFALIRQRRLRLILSKREGAPQNCFAARRRPPVDVSPPSAMLSSRLRSSIHRSAVCKETPAVSEPKAPEPSRPE